MLCHAWGHTLGTAVWLGWDVRDTHCRRLVGTSRPAFLAAPRRDQKSLCKLPPPHGIQRPTCANVRGSALWECQGHSHTVTVGLAWHGQKHGSEAQMSTSSFKCWYPSSWRSWPVADVQPLLLSPRRSETPGRPHSWHSTKLAENQPDASMMQISQGTLGTPWHQSYHSR